VIGLLRRLAALLARWAHTATRVVVHAARRVLGRLRTVAVRIAATSSAVLGGIWQRHTDRLEHDPGYRTALATGMSALLVTIAPQPAVAAALAVLVAEHVGTPARHVRVAAPEYDEDDEYERYDARRAWAPRPDSRTGQRSWDRYPD
jgi:hypothetical protein